MQGKRYSKRKIRAAGEKIVDPEASGQEREEARYVLNYWREVHREPLQRMFDDIEHLLGPERDFVVAGRIKKLDTIIDKLQRPDAPSNLAAMYDIAGCRIVVQTMEEQERLCSLLETLDAYEADKSARHDYIACPKPSGYRSRHLIFAYDCAQCGYRLRVELQVRTLLQHAWSTSVELYDRLARSRLKFNEFSDPNSIFFKRMSLVIEQLETTGACDPVAVRSRYPGSSLPPLGKRFGAKAYLEAVCDSYAIITNVSEIDSRDYCLIQLDSEMQTIEMSIYRAQEAMRAYLDFEQKSPDNVDVVLVKGASVDQIKKLYPNYFGDASEFLGLINRYMHAFA